MDQQDEHERTNWDVIVIGAGAAGLMAAAEAAGRGRRTLLLEKNRRPGVKILMSGGTRCNVTHATDRRGIVEAFGEQGPFLHSALAALGPAEVVELFAAEGVPTKVEAQGKVFPLSDKATDVLDALVARLERSGAELALDEAAAEVRRLDDARALDGGAAAGGARFAVVTTRRTLYCQSLIVTTGGRSYPGCGTSGDGYRWLAELGHALVAPRPALTPVTSHAPWVAALKGVTLDDVFLRVVSAGEATAERRTPLAQRRGALLFAHFGITGPAVLDVSRAISGHPRPAELSILCDLLPDLPVDRLDEELARACAADGKKQLPAIVARFVPRRLAETLFVLLDLSPSLRAAELSKRDRRRLAELIKRLPIPVSGTMGFRKAEVTAGGVSLDEVDSRSMESKLVRGLFLAGEILDLDGPIGGYNFQAAFSTGMLAGRRA